MTPQERQELKQLQDEVSTLKELLYLGEFPNKKEFYKDVAFKGNVGFYGEIPIAKQATVTTPSGGATVDTQSRTAIGEIKTLLTNLGLTL